MKHPLEDCRAKVTWAYTHHLRQIDLQLRSDWGKRLRGHSILRKIDTETRLIDDVIRPIKKSVIFSLRGYAPTLPIAATLHAGEAIHQLRTALDHLVYQLVIAHTKNPPSFRSAFPIIGTGRMIKPGWQSAADYYAAQVSTLRQSISHDAEALIQGLQPYKRFGGAYENDPLWQLSEFDNSYKHRLLAVVAHKLKWFEATIRKDEDIIATARFEPNIMFEDGAEIGRIELPDPSIIDEDMKVQTKAMFAIAFPKVANLTNVGVLDWCETTQTYVNGIIDRFWSLPEFS